MVRRPIRGNTRRSLFRAAWVLYALGLLLSGTHVAGDAAVWIGRFPDQVTPRLFVGLMLFVLCVFTNILFVFSFIALRSTAVRTSWKAVAAGSLLVNAGLLLFIPRYALELGYWPWLLAFAVLGWALIVSPADAAAASEKDPKGVPALVWIWLALTFFWMGVTTVTYLDRNDVPSARPGALQGYVTDEAHLLDAATTSRIVSALAGLENETTNQIAVAIYPSAPPEGIDDFTFRTAERSRLGARSHDNGAILFLFPRERVARMEVGYGLEGVLPDAMVHRILATRLVPSLARGDYGAGVAAAIDSIIATVRTEYRAAPAPGFLGEMAGRVRIAFSRIGTEAWPFLRATTIDQRVGISFFTSLLMVVVWGGLANAARLIYAAIRGIANIIRRRPIGSGIAAVQFAPIWDTLKVLVFFVAIVQGIVLIAGGGAFGGAGAQVHW